MTQLEANGIAGPGTTFDEMTAPDGTARPEYLRLCQTLRDQNRQELARRHLLGRRAFRDHGITFSVSHGDHGIEKLFPFDPIPRIIDAASWGRLERGLKQRARALNAFLDDVYGGQRILRQGVVPPEIVLSSSGFRRELLGLQPPGRVRAHIAGIDLVRDEHGQYLVLEDNLRTPSGMSYVLAGRQVLRRTFPELFQGYSVRPVEMLVHQLLENLQRLKPAWCDRPTVVLLTPGIFNSAYFEHLYLAKQMGVELVEGGDLVVDQDRVFMRTTRGLQPVHVIYRRVDDDFIDPLYGRADSLVGVPGLIDAYRVGGVGIANGFGNGVADDKAVYPLVGDMIHYYLGEDPIIPNVPTYLCSRPAERHHVLLNLERLVVKEVDQSGGHGMLIGPASTAAQREGCARRIEASPRSFIAQPVINLSMEPVLVEGRLTSRHQDLRPFVLSGETEWVTPGGLTRIALRPGSLVVNSSQGGGSRDTWVVD
jgi:uncharacterized circularly permuted ATP-grasp superfamily protein